VTPAPQHPLTLAHLAVVLVVWCALIVLAVRWMRANTREDREDW
jgi:hypothetical protein